MFLITIFKEDLEFLPIMKKDSAQKIHGAQSVHRTIQILKLIANNSNNGVRLREIADVMDLKPPTVHRFLKAMIEENIIVKDPSSKRYSLGGILFELGLAAARNFNIVNLCTPYLKNLAQKTGDTSFIFIRNGNDAVCIAREQGPYHVQTPVVPIGGRQPLGVSAGGLALLSALTRDEIHKILKETELRLDIYGGLTIEDALHFCEEAKAKQYALIANKAVPGICGLGLPILDKSKNPIAAITVASTIHRMTSNHVRDILPDLRDAAQEITELLLDM